MTTFPGSPRLLKGAIIGIDPFNPLASVVVFQYNPDSMTRTLTAQTTGPGADRGEAQRLKGPPEEKIRLEILLDATDQLEKGQAPAITMGVYPALSSLEMLLYPKSSLMIANEVLAAAGIIEIIPPESPLTLLVWGPARSVPVRITEFSIAEEAYDTALNPIRAKVTLGLRVLTYLDVGLATPAGALFMAHQVIKEVMATIGSANSAVAAFGA